MVVVNAADGEDPEPRGVMADVFERLGESVERILDKVFDKPYVVPDADAARRLMLDQDARRPSAISQFVQNQAVVRLTSWIAKSSRFGGTGATTAVTALLGSGQRARRVIRRGTLQLQVLASFVASRAHRAGITLERDFVRAVTLDVYLEPHRVVEFRYRGRRAGGTIARRWAKDALSSSDERPLIESRVSAIERLDLDDLHRRWHNP